MGMIKFNGASSKDFGVEVETFPNYVAPQKEYEAIHIPGRNGDLLIDSGTYSNVEKRYKVNMVKEPPATEVSGPIANFKSNVSLPLSELKTNIDPVQDLHGYSKPWIGGAGKNLFNYDAWKTVSINRGTAVFENNGVTLTATGNDAYTDFSNTSFPVDARVPITEGETITLSWQETTNTSGIVIIFPNGMTSGMVTVNNAAVKKATYTATSGITYVSFRFGVANSGDTIAYKNIQIEKGSQATSWEPYENICPITGSTSANIIRCGANLWDEEWELGALAWATGQPILSTDRIRSKNYCHIKGGNNYYIKVDTSKSGTPYLFYYDKNLNYISNTSDTTTINRVISIPDNAVFFKIVIIQTTVYNNNVSVNYPSSDTEYHAYKGSKYQSYFSGLANGTYGVVDLGTLNWINEDSVVSGLARVSDIQVVPLGAKYLQTPICTNFLGVLPKAYLDFNFGEIGFSNGTTRTFIRARSTEFIGKTNSEIKALMSGVYLIYELATPTTPTITQTDLDMLISKFNADLVCVLFGQTVYGGSLNVTTGELTIDRAYDLNNSSTGWIVDPALERAYKGFPDIKPAASMTEVNPILQSNYLPTESADNVIAYKKQGITVSTGVYVSIHIDGLTNDPSFNTTMFNTFLQNNPLEIVYPLNNPITIQLTAEEIKTFIGENNIFSDSGDVDIKTNELATTYSGKMELIANWLNSASGYARLEDSYDPDYYRLAYFNQALDIENLYDEAGRVELSFICKPQKFYKSGEDPVVFTSAGKIQNRTQHTALPLLKVKTDNTDGTVSIGNSSFGISAGSGTDIIIDCELQNAYYGIENKNNYIVLNDGDFPRIEPGTQVVSFTGGVQSVEVIPRWWTV